MRNRNSTQALSYKYYFLPVLLLVLLGLADTAYLVLSHYRNYTDTTYSSFCALSKAINCDTVSQSPWSVLFGLPVAVWGFFGYLVYGVLLIAARKNIPERITLWNILFILGLLYSISAIYFGYISATKIHSYCILCIFSYGISFSLLFYSWIIRRRFGIIPFLSRTTEAIRFAVQDNYIRGALLALVISFIWLKLFLPHYWTYTLPEIPPDIPTGLTEEGHPWIGAENPLLTIEEFADYQCFQCYKMHFMLRRLIDEHPEKIRLIHRHFPMDHTINEIIVPTPFHVGSGKMALMAIYAASQGKFWEANDALFKLGRNKKPFNTKTLAEKTGLSAGALAIATRNKNIRLFLQNDIRQGMKLGITGTPSFVINGKVYTGSIPAEILENIIQ